MQNYQSQTITASKQNLVRLCIIRCIVLLGQWLALFYANRFLNIELNDTAIQATLAVMSVITILTFIRIKQPWPVVDIEFFSHLLIDIFGLSILLYYSGGASNPFISYYLIPISISAAVLPWIYTWSITTICIGLYSIMLYYYIPLPFFEPHMGHHTATNDFFSNVHIMGMWANFAVSSILITYFVVKMAKAIRKQEETILKSHELNQKNEQLISVATLAAGTAHELGTPLSTMAIVLSEMQSSLTGNNELKDDIQVLKQQVAKCKDILQALTDTAEKSQSEALVPSAVDLYLNRIIDQWSVIRPGIHVEINIQNNNQTPTINTSPVLDQALTNLLNNAADANISVESENKTRIEIELRWSSNEISISINDYGPGIGPDVMENIGKPFLSKKRKGLGLGLFLTHTTITRLGGQVRLFNRESSGTTAEIILPLSSQ